jgi:hypothetical protein
VDDKEIVVRINGEIIGWIWDGMFNDINEGDEGDGN